MREQAKGEKQKMAESTAKAEVSSSLTCGGPTARVLLKEEDYLIINKEGQLQGECIDIDYAHKIIRIYQDEEWSIHPMTRHSQTNSIKVLETS